MKNSRTTAERIRPILQAMERSIDAARQKRLQGADGPAQPRPLAVDPHPVGDGAIPPDAMLSIAIRLEAID